MVVGARQAGLSISSAQLLGFSHTTISMIYKEWCEKGKTSSMRQSCDNDNEFSVLKWPPQSADLNPIEHLWDVVERELCDLDVHPTNFQVQNAILSIWANISKECFLHLI